MDKQGKDLRRAAAQAFLDSLDKLGETLQIPPEVNPKQPDPPPAAPPPIPAPPPVAEKVQERPANPDRRRKAPPAFTLDELEQAVADIEQFMKSQHPPDSST